MEGNELGEVGEEARGFVVLDFAVLDGFASEICVHNEIYTYIKGEKLWREHTVVELDGLVGCGSCLVLRGVAPKPEVQIVGDRL